MVLKHTGINTMLFIISKSLLGFCFMFLRKILESPTSSWSWLSIYTSVNFCLMYFESTLGVYGYMLSSWHYMSYSFSFINVNVLKSILPNNIDFILPFTFKIAGFIFNMNLLSGHSTICYFFTQFLIWFI